MDYAVVAFYHFYVLAYACVAVEVAWCLFVQGAPGAEVAPSEVGRADEYLLGLLHDGIVYGDVLTFGVQAVYGFLLLRCAKDVEHTLEDLAERWLVDTEGVDDGLHVPEEDARVPEEIALLDVLLRSLKVWLLAEPVHTEYLLVAWRAGAEVGLYVAVACLGACGLHAKGDYGIGLASELQALCYHSPELLRIGHEVIAWRYDDVGLWVFLLYAPADVGYAWRGVAATGLEQDVPDGYLRELLVDNVRILAVGDHPHVLRVADTLETVVGELHE